MRTYPWRRRSYRRPAFPPVDEASRALHARLPVTDLHAHPLFHLTYWGNDVGLRQRSPTSWNPIGACQWDLPRAIEGGVKLQLFTVYVPIRPLRRRSNLAETVHQLDVFDRFVARHGDRVGHARTIDEARALNEAGRLALMLCVEGGHSLGGDPAQVGRLRDRGVRYLTMVHFEDNGLLQGVEQPVHRQPPLTELGRAVLGEMDRHRMIVDLAHATRASFDAVCEATEGVLVSTHGGVQRFAPRERNLADDQLDEIARRGGLVGVIALPLYLKNRVRADVRDVADVICYLCERIGPEHVALGTDWDGFIWAPAGFKGVHALPCLTAELRRRGLTDEEISGVMGANAQALLARFDRPEDAV